MTLALIFNHTFKYQKVCEIQLKSVEHSKQMLYKKNAKQNMLP